MAKETMIVFVYDTEHCKDEADDPVDAVLYFHPGWVSDTQKVSLCGQLMGITYFFRDCFFKPKIISLQNGKFVLNEFGRFILAVGTDRNISETILIQRSKLLTSLVKTFHHDIQTIHEQFTSNGQYKNLSEKLYHIFETYLPLLQHNGNVFQNLPTIRLPKSASNIFLDSMQTLQSCQQTKGVLGGVLLYHNKVVATQLSPMVTKNFVLTDPYRIRSTADQIKVDFHIPNGVQMLIVYIPKKEYQNLLFESQRSQNVLSQNFSNSSFPYQFQKRKIKRDKSLIFTNIPEEGSEDNILIENIKPRTINRPNHLPLRFRNTTTKDLPESGFVSINFDETDSFPEFIGRTSVCSTPMTENKILHGNILPICANQNENLCSNNSKDSKTKDISLDKKNLFTKFDFSNFFSNFITKSHKIERQNSLTDFQDSVKKFSKRLNVRPFDFGFMKIEDDNQDDLNSDYMNNLNYVKHKTITDPIYPLFNSDGDPISKSLFQELLRQQNVEKDLYKSKQEISVTKDIIVDNNTFEVLEKKNIEKENIIVNILPNKKELNKRLLTLPLKPLNEISEKDENININSVFDRKKQPGVQLTPLMSKLSMLAFNEEKSSGFCSWDITPGIELATPIDNIKNNFRRKSLIKTDDTTDMITNELEKVELYICGQQNMTLLLLLEQGASTQQNLVQSLFDTCISRLTRIEANLNQTLNINIDGDKSEGGYSYICLDPNWDTIQRGGPWSPIDMLSLEYMHKDLNMKHPITDLLLRAEDGVIYGYKCGQTEVFYKQSANKQSGLPSPADLIGTVSMRAKRRMERDHTFILL